MPSKYVPVAQAKSHKRLPKDKRDLMVELLSAGRSVKQVIAATGASKATASRYKRELKMSGDAIPESTARGGVYSQMTAEMELVWAEEVLTAQAGSPAFIEATPEYSAREALDVGKTYKGSCHCQRTRFEVRSALEDVTSCDCSICRRRGTLIQCIAEERFRLLTPSDRLTAYRWNTQIATDYFCAMCGVLTHRRSRTAPSGIAVNVRCLEDVDFDGLRVRKVFGSKLSRVLRKDLMWAESTKAP